MPIPRGVSQSPQMNRLYKALEAYTDERPAVEVLGVSDSGIGSDVTLTFRANRHTPHVYVHVQSDKAGEGGESYDASNFVTDTRYNAVGNKKHTVTISRDDDAHYYAYLVPAAQVPPGCGSYTKFDGVDGEDFMSFADLGKRTVAEAELENGAVTSDKLADAAVTAQKLTESGRSFVTDVEFTPASDTEVTWGSGSLILADGTPYAISSGTTGAMADATYVYFDPSVSTTAFQTTTTLADATGERRVLIGVAGPANDASQNAAFISSRQVAVNESHLSVNAVTANVIAAAAVTAAKINAGAVETSKLDALAVTAEKIAAEAIEAGKIKAGAIDATDLFVDGIITAAKMNVTTLEAIAAQVGTLDITDDLFLASSKRIKYGTSASPTTITKTVRYPATFFVPQNESIQFGFAGYVFARDSTAAAELSCTIVLADGAEIKEVRARMYRETTSQTVSAELFRVGNSPGTTPGTSLGSVSASYSGSWETGSITGLSEVVGGTDTYHVEIDLDRGGGSERDARLLWVEVDYEVSSLSQAL